MDVLHEAHVLFVHGSGFGHAGDWHFRIVFLPPADVLEEAMDRFEAFMRKRLAE